MNDNALVVYDITPVVFDKALVLNANALIVYDNALVKCDNTFVVYGPLILWNVGNHSKYVNDT